MTIQAGISAACARTFAQLLVQSTEWTWPWPFDVTRRATLDAPKSEEVPFENHHHHHPPHRRPIKIIKIQRSCRRTSSSTGEERYSDSSLYQHLASIPEPGCGDAPPTDRRRSLEASETLPCGSEVSLAGLPWSQETTPRGKGFVSL